MKIAIKLPNDLTNRILAFPMLHKLVQHFEEKIAESDNPDEAIFIHLICLEKDIDALNLLPFKAYYHELVEEDLSNIFSIHRACKNFKLDKPDIFISAEDGFLDASIGKNINAIRSIGFNLGKNKWALSEVVSALDGQHLSAKYFNLISTILEKEESIPHVQRRDLEPLIEDWQMYPYTVICLDLAEDGEVNSEWIDFIDLFSNKKFIFMLPFYDEIKHEDVIKKFISKLKDENIYEVFEYKSNIDLAKLLVGAVTFITQELKLMHLAAYCGGHTFYLSKNENLQIVGPEYMRGDVRAFMQSDPAYGDETGFKYTPIFDEIFSFIDMRSTTTED